MPNQYLSVIGRQYYPSIMFVSNWTSISICWYIMSINFIIIIIIILIKLLIIIIIILIIITMILIFIIILILIIT